MKFKLFDGDKKFHPSVLFWIFELHDDKGVIVDQYFFFTHKGAMKFWKDNEEQINRMTDLHPSVGGEVFWFN